MGLNESAAVSYYEQLQIQKIFDSEKAVEGCVAFITNFKNSMANFRHHNCIETRRKKTRNVSCPHEVSNPRKLWKRFGIFNIKCGWKLNDLHPLPQKLILNSQNKIDQPLFRADHVVVGRKLVELYNNIFLFSYKYSTKWKLVKFRIFCGARKDVYE